MNVFNPEESKIYKKSLANKWRKLIMQCTCVFIARYTIMMESVTPFLMIFGHTPVIPTRLLIIVAGSCYGAAAAGTTATAAAGTAAAVSRESLAEFSLSFSFLWNRCQ